jgi:Uma2 family endonuclease
MTAQESLEVQTRAKLTVRDFLLLADAGAFRDYVRTELIEGEIWVVNSVHRRHARLHAMMSVELGIGLKAVGSELLLYTAPSTELSEHSLPEPDIALAEPSEGKVLDGMVVRLAVEISDSTLAMDLGRKAHLYARHGIPEYWVVDADAALVHQLWSPVGDNYAERAEIALGEPVSARTVAGLTVRTERV